MSISLIDLPEHRAKLFPFTLTRPIADLRVGILTIREKWEKHLKAPVGFLAADILQEKYHIAEKSSLVINGILCPDEGLVKAIESLQENEALFHQDLFLAARGSFDGLPTAFDTFEKVAFDGSFTAIHRAWDMFTHNGDQIVEDFKLLTAGRKSQPISDKHTIVYGEENIFTEEGVDIKAAILNAEEGPIYLGKNSNVQEGATIRGPFGLGENARINMNAKIREGVSIGPNCKVGGEVSNSIIYGNSNKAHDGYLGNAVIGEWCNLGADTNNSNLKNNYDTVKAWDYEEEKLISTGLQFCGLFMGDHSKTAINSALNTGTTVGVACNLFGSGFPPTYVPSFTWGGAPKSDVHAFDKAMKTARIVMERKNTALTPAAEKVLKTIFEAAIKNHE